MSSLILQVEDSANSAYANLGNGCAFTAWVDGADIHVLFKDTTHLDMYGHHLKPLNPRHVWLRKRWDAICSSTTLGQIAQLLNCVLVDRRGGES